MNNIAHQLAEVRRSSGISVLDLADRTGYSDSLIQKLECGHRTPSFTALLIWVEALGCELIVQRKTQ